MERGRFEELGRYSIYGLDGTRRVLAYVPRGFGGGTARGAVRPVLYMFDGQNVFGDAGSFAGGWHAHLATEKLSPRNNFTPIVVAIDHGGAKRIEELGRPEVTDRLLHWMGERLVPEVRAKFHTSEGPVGGVVAGSSMGGLAALYAHFRRPDLFGGAIAMSPSLFFAGRQGMNFIRASHRPGLSRIYLDCGAREAGGRMARLSEELGRELRRRGWDERALKVRIDPRGAHTESAWRRRLPAALRFMFKRG